MLSLSLNTILNASIFVNTSWYDLQRYVDDINQLRLHIVFWHYFWEHFIEEIHDGRFTIVDVWMEWVLQGITKVQ